MSGRKKKDKQDTYVAPDYIKRALEVLHPAEALTVSEWAEKNRVLGSGNARPGPWRNRVTPYLVGIMDEFGNYGTEEIVFCKCTQVGGTEVILNTLGYIGMQEPAPTMVVYPTDALGERTAANRIIPVFRESECMKRLLDVRNTGKSEIRLKGMSIIIAGSNSPIGLSSTPIKNLFLDEIDKFPPASRKEADPISLATERTKTYHNRKIVKVSTPTLRTGQIWKALEACDIEKHYFVPCPHCNEYIELKFKQIIWPGKEDGKSNAERARRAEYICQKCGCAITEKEKPSMLEKGEWRAVRIENQAARKVGFWMNTLYSPFVTFNDIALEFMNSKEDPEKLQNFTNSWLAEPWEQTSLKTTADMVLDRQTETPMWELPPWTKLVTGGVDVQETCLYWTIRAFGDFMTSQNVAHGQALSFEEVEKIMSLELSRGDGVKIIPQLVLVDSGDQTDLVYDFCLKNLEWALPCKGMPTRMSHYTISTVNKAGSSANGMNLVLVDGGKYKDMIAGRLRKPNGNGSWMVYRGCDEEYANQVTAEQKVVERTPGGKRQEKWVKKGSHAANHYLDAEVYAFAAADVLGVRQLFLQPDLTEKRTEKEEKKETENWISGGWN